MAVFPEAEGLTDDEMQKIAREMNLSETVFVLPSEIENALRRLRIFTPRRELPIAGHPVVGAWNLLAKLGVLPVREGRTGYTEIQHELGIGVLPVEIEMAGGKPMRVVMTQGKFEPGEIITGEPELQKLALALGLEREDIVAHEKLPVQVVSTGVRSIAIPVSSLETLGKIKVNSSLLSGFYLARDAVGCYVFTLETKDGGLSRAHARFFAPEDNIPEDAATGGAAGPLASYLVYHDAISASAESSRHHFTIEQGDFMQRPSRIFADITGAIGKIENVRIGGASVVVAQGEVFI